jgi:hypothetical protein
MFSDADFANQGCGLYVFAGGRDHNNGIGTLNVIDEILRTACEIAEPTLQREVSMMASRAGKCCRRQKGRALQLLSGDLFQHALAAGLACISHTIFARERGFAKRLVDDLRTSFKVAMRQPRVRPAKRERLRRPRGEQRQVAR